MAYTASTLRLISSDLEGSAPKKWIYTTTDALATIIAAGYFTDGGLRGMKVGDLVEVVNTTGPKYLLTQVTAISSNAVTIAAPTAIT